MAQYKVGTRINLQRGHKIKEAIEDGLFIATVIILLAYCLFA